MGTYFADQEQISRLRMKNRATAQDLISAQGISMDAAGLALPPYDEKVAAAQSL